MTDCPVCRGTDEYTDSEGVTFPCWLHEKMRLKEAMTAETTTVEQDNLIAKHSKISSVAQ